VRRLFQHVVIYAAVNAFIIAIWVLIGGGSMEKLQQVSQSPGDALQLNFWPVWSILAWGTGLVIHAGVVFSDLLTPSRSRARRRKRIAREAASGAKDLAKEVVAAIDKAHERRIERNERRDARERRRDGGKAATPAASAPERRWVTVMFCDIADSTSHNERLGDEEWHRVLAHIRGILRAALAQRDGAEVGTSGDGMLARFGAPPDAVLCAVDIQSELGQARDASDFVPEVRIGIHAGDAVEDEGDLIGRVINLASRVTGEATPGEILVTEPVADQLVGKLELEDRGLRPLKGMAQPRHLLAVRWSADAQG
jgi:class 3 adenylate cyclase